jgi:7-cyano-7-deazaguanine synthase in queuosine biosynthesis
MAMIREAMLKRVRELDRSESVRRVKRTLRNLLTDPLPRNRELVFDSYTFVYPTLSFVYKAAGKSYVSRVNLRPDIDRDRTIVLPGLAQEDLATIDAATFHRIATTIGITLAPFHFLLTDFATVRIDPGDFIDESGRQFFSRYLQSSLAEFRFRQGLDPTRAIAVTVRGSNSDVEPETIHSEDRLLLLNGGGKDSAVMAELAKRTGLPLSWCSVNPGERQKVLERASQIADGFSLQYRVDPAIKQDGRYKWGHVPYAALFMSVSLLVAVAHRFRYVAIGNEYSASFGNIRYKGVELNHQYSKSYAYETAFQQYLDTSVVRGVSYFSLLRPFHDLRIAAMLSRMTGYVGSFVSCNSNDGMRWCGDCAKCAFTFLALMPWNSREVLERIFGSSLIDKAPIRRYILDLTVGRLKPWECVGTREECQLALALVLMNHPELEFAEPPHREALVHACAGIDVPGTVRELVGKAHTPHSVPGELWARIEPEAAQLTDAAIAAAGRAAASSAGCGDGFFTTTRRGTQSVGARFF